MNALAPFRVGVVGAGGVADGYHIPVLKQLSGVEVPWVADLDLSKATQVARRHGVPISVTSLSDVGDVDAVLVAIPVGARGPVLKTVFSRQWHAFIEKPFATTACEHRQILDDAGKAGVQVGVGFIRRFYRAIVDGRDLLGSGVLGPIREVWAAEGGLMRGSGRGDDWYQGDAKAAGGGVLAETGSHLIDQALFLTGAIEVRNVHASARRAGALDLETFVSLTARRPAQPDPFELRVVLSRLRGVAVGVTIQCQHGAIRCGVGSGGQLELLDQNLRPSRTIAPRAAGADAVYQAFALEWMAFIDQCRTALPSTVDASSAILTTEVIESAYGAMAASV